MYDLEMLEAWHEYNEHNLPLTFAEFCYQKGRADAIDEFYNRLLDNKKEINTSNYPWNYIELVAREMTEQLKEQKNV